MLPCKKSASDMFRPEATRRLTLIFAPLPNMIPAGLMRNICPLLNSVPLMSDGLACIMRFNVAALLDGCAKSTILPALMLNLLYSIMVLGPPVVIVVVLPLVLNAAEPCVTFPPSIIPGTTSAKAAEKGISDSMQQTSRKTTVRLQVIRTGRESLMFSALQVLTGIIINL